MRLGLVTYNLAKDWDVDTIIANCTETGFEGVELRTTHAHGVEVELSAAARQRSIDLVALATRGRTGVLVALRGCTTERLLARSPCAVLAVPVS